MKQINWGILSTGKIASVFAQNLKKVSNAKIYAVGSRNIKKAELFAKKFNIPNFYGNYSELAKDPEIDVIYVATPHSFHKNNTILCLEHGKTVLCEKAFSVNKQEAIEMVNCANKNKLFLMEAMWTRFLPCIVTVRQWLNENRIGKIKSVTADFGFCAERNPKSRLFNPHLAGGALLDIGVYTISFASMVFGSSPCEIKAVSHIGKTSVDEQTAIILKYKQGIAQLLCSITSKTQNTAWIIGTNGSICVPNFWTASSATLFVNNKPPLTIKGDCGYQFEASEVMNCIRKGIKESSIMPLSETLAIMGIMDKVRKIIGLKYPTEIKKPIRLSMV